MMERDNSPTARWKIEMHEPELGPCVCSHVRRLARKLSSLFDSSHTDG